MKAQHRNLEIDLLKFLYSWVIVFYHFFQEGVGSEGPRCFIGGYYGVEFYLLMHAMGPNVAGVIGSAVAAGFLLIMFQ